VDIEKLKAENARLLSELTTAQTSVTTLTSERDELSGKVTKLTADNAELTTKVANAPADQSAEVISLTEARDKLLNEKTELTKERDNLKAINTDAAIETKAREMLVDLAADAGIPIKDAATAEAPKGEGGKSDAVTGYDRILAATKVVG
jgi:chromosome segregation ATPase